MLSAAGENVGSTVGILLTSRGVAVAAAAAAAGLVNARLLVV